MATASHVPAATCAGGGTNGPAPRTRCHVTIEGRRPLHPREAVEGKALTMSATTREGRTSPQNPGAAGTPVYQESIVTRPIARWLLAISRIVIGFYFLWGFLDKAFGLRFSTMPEGRWEVFGGTGTPAASY
ncbi:hypothetical protein KILIM_018_00010, partial [Kineosphaera limosa NBRC 100340]